MNAPATSQDAAVDVGAVLDKARFGGVQLVVTVFMFLAQMMDGFDLQVVAFTAPSLTGEWGITRPALGPVLAAALLGMALGAATLGPLGDRLGRKTALIACCLLMAFGSVASAFATGVVDMTIWRFVTGIAMGGVLPLSTALIFEFAPLKSRQIVTTLVLIGVPLGGLVGAALARWLIPVFGWQSMFLIGGVSPALLALMMWLWLAESPRYLRAHPRRHHKLARLLRRIDPEGGHAPGQSYVAGDAESVAKASVRTLFRPEYRRDTLVLWLIFFTNVFAVYIFFNWLPTVLSAAGLSLAIALSASLYYNLGGIFGTLLSSPFISRYGSRRVLVPVSLGSALCVALLGASPVFSGDNSGTAGLMWIMAAVGACISIVQIGMFAVAANVYPTQIRATGVGWSVAVSRFGGVANAFAGSALFALGVTPGGFFFAVAAVLMATCLGVTLLGRHIAPAGLHGVR